MLCVKTSKGDVSCAGGKKTEDKPYLAFENTLKWMALEICSLKYFSTSLLLFEIEGLERHDRLCEISRRFVVKLVRGKYCWIALERNPVWKRSCRTRKYWCIPSGVFEKALCACEGHKDRKQFQVPSKKRNHGKYVTAYRMKRIDVVVYEAVCRLMWCVVKKYWQFIMMVMSEGVCIVKIVLSGNNDDKATTTRTSVFVTYPENVLLLNCIIKLKRYHIETWHNNLGFFR